MKISVDTASLDSLFDELQGALEDGARPAAQAAAQVLYDQVKKNVEAIGHITGKLDQAIYQAYSRKGSGDGRARYEVSWNFTKAPHGHLLEFGYIQRYATYVGKDGHWYTAIRPEMRGKPRPGRHASQARKDAYYVLRPGGPVQWLGKAFVRSASSRFPQALAAAEAELLKRIIGK